MLLLILAVILCLLTLAWVYVPSLHRARRATLPEGCFRGKTALVTGASSGIGANAALELARKGARVLLLARNLKQLKEVEDWISAQVSGASVGLLIADLSSSADVLKVCSGLKETVHILVNNAGVFGAPFQLTAEGHETQLSANHLGHFLLTTQLLKTGKLSSDARLVLVTGAIYTKGSTDLATWNPQTEEQYSPVQAYCNSKLAVCLFGLELHKQFSASQSQPCRSVFVVHPGVVYTQALRHVIVYFPSFLRPLVLKIAKRFMWSPSDGCQNIVFCASDSCTFPSGSYSFNCRQEDWDPIVDTQNLSKDCWQFSAKLLNLEAPF